MPKPLLRFGDTTFLERIVGVLGECDLGGITVVLGSQAEMVLAVADLSGVDVVVNGDYREGQLSSLIAGLRECVRSTRHMLQPGSRLSENAGWQGLPNAMKRVGGPQPQAKLGDGLSTSGDLYTPCVPPSPRPSALRLPPKVHSLLTHPLRNASASTDAILLCLVDNPFTTTDVVGRIVMAFRESGKPIVVPVFHGRRGHPTLFAASVFDELLNAPANEGARHVVNADRTRVLEVEVPERAILARIDTPEDYAMHFHVPPQIREER